MWFLVRNYSVADTYAAPPDFPGTYVILARVRSVGNRADFDAQATMVFEVLEPPPVSAVGFSSDTANPAVIQTPGTVTFIAEVPGGSDNVEYQFWIQYPNGV
jgi:hypothetical protein